MPVLSKSPQLRQRYVATLPGGGQLMWQLHRFGAGGGGTSVMNNVVLR
jgi:hypothetical protein